VFASFLADVKRPSPPRRDVTVNPVTNSIKEKKMGKTLCASVLVLALCCSAFAGDIPNPPAPGDMGCPPLAAGDINSPPGATQSSDDQTTDDLAAAALSVINSVLALL
jgi:hypothetical protein